MSHEILSPVLETELSRRDVLRNAIAGALLTLPWVRSAEAAIPAPPQVTFTSSRTGDVVRGPYGELRVLNANGLVLPAVVTANGGAAMVNLVDRKAYVQIGTDDTLITYSSDGVQFGKGARAVAWSPDTTRKLVEAVSKDRRKARALMNLRGALQMNYPAAVVQLKGTTEKRVATAHHMASAGLGSRSMANCTTRTVTDTVTHTITEYVNVWKTAEKQYQECYDKEVRGSTCSILGPGAGLCAAGICLAKGFVDILVAVHEVTRTVTEEVTRTLLVCLTPKPGSWPQPWDIFDNLPVKFALPQPQSGFTAKDIEGALKFLRELTGFFGPFAKCLLSGKWSLAQLSTPITFGDGTVALPYGVKVCVSAQCGREMAATQVAGELAASWGAALGALAAMSTAFASYAAALGITAAPAVAAAVAAAGGAGSVLVSCAAVILAFIILALIYGTALSFQLAFHDKFLGTFADGEVCIEHASFAIALVKMASMGVLPVELIPPIVTG